MTDYQALDFVEARLQDARDAQAMTAEPGAALTPRERAESEYADREVRAWEEFLDWTKGVVRARGGVA